MNTRRTWLGFLGFTIIAVAVALNSARAADYTWDGSTDIWSSLHWLPGPVAGPVAATDTATIGSGTVNFSQHDTFGNANITVSPDITLNTGGTLSNDGGVGNWFNTIWNLNLNGGTLYANGGHGTWGAFALGGTVTVGGAAASTISGNGTANARIDVRNDGTTFDVADVTGDASADLTISAVVANGGGSWDAGRLNKRGGGTLTLTGDSTYTGRTYVEAGTLEVNGGSIGSGNWIDIGAEATATAFILDSGSVTVGGQFVVGAHGGDSTVTQNGGNLQVNGTLYMGGYNDNTVAGTGTFTHVAGDVTIAGPNRWLAFDGGGKNHGIYNLNGGTLTVANGIGMSGGAGTGAFNFNGGTLRASVDTATLLKPLTGGVTVQDSGGTIDNAGHAVTVTAPLAHGGIAAIDGGLVCQGSGTLTLSGVNTFTGDTLINDGRVKLGNALALQYSAYDTTGSTGPIGLDVTGYPTPTLGGLKGSVDLATAITGYGSVSSLTLNPQAGSVTYSGSVGDGAGGMALTKTGDGTQSLTGVNAFTGPTICSGGTLDIASGGSVSGIPVLNTKNGGSIEISGTVTLANSSSFGVGAGVGGTTGSVIVNPGGVLNIGGANGFTGIGGKDATGAGLGNGSLTIAGGTLNVGAPGLNNGGPGGLDATRLWLNPYGSGGGASTINLDGGTLSTARQIQDGAPSQATTIFNFNGGTLQAAAVSAGVLLASFDRVNVRDGGGTIDTIGFDIAFNHTLLHSDIGGDNAVDGGLTKAGSGTLTLTGANTFTGPTLVNDGKVVLGNASALQYSAYDTTGSTGPIGLDVTGYTTLTLGGLEGSVDLATAITGYDSVSSLILNPQVGAFTYDGVISDGVAGMSLTKTGGGTQVVAGVNTFTGPTICSGGTLDIGSGGSVSGISRLNTKTTGEITISGTVTLAASSSFGVGAGLQGTTGSLTVNPGGVLNIGGVNGFTGIGGGDVFAQRDQSGNGTLTIVGGTLNVGAPGANNGGPDGLDATMFWMHPYGDGGGTSSINLDGGTLSIARPIQRGSGGTSIFNFNGGTLEAAAASAGSLLVSMTRVNVRDGGGTIDTKGLSVTYNQTLLHSDIGGDAAIDGGLTKAGSGTLTLGGANTFNGDLIIDDGTLIDTVQANNANPAATGLGNMTTPGRTITVNSAGTLVFGASDAMGSYQYKTPVVIAADGGTIINGSGRFMSIGDISLKNGGRLVTTNGANVLYQAFNVRGSITVSGTSGSFISATGTGLNGVHLGGTTTAATTFDVGATGDPTADLMVTAPLLDEVYNVGSLIKTGAGRMVVSAVCSYTGSTTVDDGTLAFGADNVLSSVNDVFLAGGGLDMGAFDNTLGILEVTGNSTITLGSGTLRFENSNTVPWTGTLTLVGTLGSTTVQFANSLTPAQLQKINVGGNPVDIDADGYLTKASQGTLFVVQ